ncbi:PQQ-dependent sugar dehydrogenase, partial [Bacillus sp. S34]|nr:PQQ-dependent sugar dehydrogenase [Bacillus sp. S34]
MRAYAARILGHGDGEAEPLAGSDDGDGGHDVVLPVATASCSCTDSTVGRSAQWRGVRTGPPSRFPITASVIDARTGRNTVHTTPRPHRTWVALGAAAVTALVLTACTDDGARTLRGTASATTAPTTAPTTSAPGLLAPGGEPSDLATGLDAPWSVVRTGDGVDALISERDSAKVLELTAAGTTREVGTVEGVSAGGEGGLLGLALHDGDLFVYSTAEDGNRIQRYDLTGSAGSYALGDATTIIDGLPSNSFHNGGRIAFGPDGMLYA